MTSRELLSIIDKVHIWGKILHPYRTEGDNTDDPLQKLAYQLVEIIDILIDGMDEEQFQHYMKTKAEEFITDTYQILLTCGNRDQAIMLLETVINNINVYCKEKYKVAGERVTFRDQNPGVLYHDWGAADELQPYDLYQMESKIWDKINYFIYNKILLPIIEELSDANDRLRITRLSTFKSNLKSIVPPTVPVKPSLQRNRYSFELNSEIVGLGAKANHKIEQVGKLLSDAGIINHTPDLGPLLVRIFNNKPVTKKLRLSRNCNKGFFRVLLNRLKEEEIILNRDYFKAATVCFEYEQDTEYSLLKLKKTTPTADRELLALVEKCVKAFCHGRP